MAGRKSLPDRVFDSKTTFARLSSCSSAVVAALADPSAHETQHVHPVSVKLRCSGADNTEKVGTILEMLGIARFARDNQPVD